MILKIRNNIFGVAVFASANLVLGAPVADPPFVERAHIGTSDKRAIPWPLSENIRQQAKQQLFGRMSPEQIIDDDRTWPLTPALTKIVITVAFSGGDPVLYRQIKEVANQWTSAANISFDFGDQDGQFRQWSQADDPEHPVAMIRIAFVAANGYSSLIGQEALTAVAGNEATMNLGGFDQSLPARWRYLVLHEFGHALGLRHELQHPGSTCTLRWADDPGYEPEKDVSGTAIWNANGKRPGVYTYLGSAPNYWFPSEVDKQMAVIRDTTGLDITEFDPSSVMIYPLETWLYVDPSSPCALERSVLSPRDKSVIAAVYPSTADGLKARQEKNQMLMRAIKNIREDMNFR